MLVWPLAAAFLCVYFNFNIFTAGILFYSMPAIYLTFKCSGERKKIFWISAAWALVWLSFDYFWETNRAWVVNSAFDYRLFGVISVEMIGFAIVWPYLIITFYEYFVERDGKREKTRRGGWKLLEAGGLIFGVIALYELLMPRPLKFTYSYLIMGVLFLIPTLVILYKFPRLLRKFLAISIYFFYQALIIEIVGLSLGYWSFPTESGYIGQVAILGYRFPLEELLLWMAFSTVIILSIYEFFDDDRK